MKSRVHSRRRGGRAVECTGLENRSPATPDRGFESRPLRLNSSEKRAPAGLFRCPSSPETGSGYTAQGRRKPHLKRPDWRTTGARAPATRPQTERRCPPTAPDPHHLCAVAQAVRTRITKSLLASVGRACPIPQQRPGVSKKFVPSRGHTYTETPTESATIATTAARQESRCGKFSRTGKGTHSRDDMVELARASESPAAHPCSIRKRRSRPTFLGVPSSPGRVVVRCEPQ
jgi:hypothetical protein